MSDTKSDTDKENTLIELICQDDDESIGLRLDQYINSELDELSRARVKKLIETDPPLVTVNNTKEKPSYKLRPGDVVQVKIPPLEPAEIEAEDLNLDIVFEDDHLVVVNKPIGMVTHPGAGISSGTLVNGLLHHCKDSLSGISGEQRPGIVHRLDKDTSGILVVAKNDNAHRSLAKQIQEKTAIRKYTAIAHGCIKNNAGKIEAPIGRHPVKRKQMAVIDSGRHATTLYELKASYHTMSLLSLELKTGRTHQIRVHLAHLGYPVVGDLIYNKKGTGTEKARKKLGLKGHALHATSLSFIHPVSEELLEFTKSPPEEFMALVDRLEKGWR